MTTPDEPKDKDALEALEKQVLSVMEGIKSNPDKKKAILIGYVSHVYEAVKQTILKSGAAMPHYVILSDTPEFGGPEVTDEIITKAQKLNAEAVVSVEGFESQDDITDVIYHVSMSAPSVGVLGWVFKVKLADGTVDIVKEKPYLFGPGDKIKTLGELVAELEVGEDE